MASYQLKGFGEQVLPARIFLAVIESFRRFAPSRRRKFEIELGERLMSSGRVLDGPFTGMHYLELSYGSAYLPKLLGCYELEVRDFVTDCCENPPDVVVDIGAAEGYYAVGFALRVPEAQIFTYDTSEVAHILTRRMAAMNHVSERINVLGLCDHAALAEVLAESKSPVVVCDCEGGERDLMDPELAPTLRKARLLVETHTPEIADLLYERLSKTHTVQRVGQQPRVRPEALVGKMTDEEWRRASDEARVPGQAWLLCVPLAF